jgi:N-acetylneuraminate synthase
MGKYDTVELQGPEREQALAEIAGYLKSWGVTMPPVEPLPLHFGLHRFREIGETEFWIANEEEHGYCGKFIIVLEGQTCPGHYHRIKHETFFVVKGRIRMRVNDEEREMAEGDVLPMPAGTGHSFTGVGGPALILEVSMPSMLRDNFFADPAIGEGGVI